MPAKTPEIGDRGGCPRAVGDRRPLPGRLSKEDTSYERRDVVIYVDGRVHYHGSAYGVECRPGTARDDVQGRVEDGVSCGNVDGWPEVLHEVVGDIVHYEFEEQFG